MIRFLATWTCFAMLVSIASGQDADAKVKALEERIQQLEKRLNETARRLEEAQKKPSATPAQGPAPARPRPLKEGWQKTERERVMACGFTEAEADCWVVLADAAGKFFALPTPHSMDDHEVAHATHVIQQKLLGRPTYRRYLELAKREKKK
jgi:hypothetical protein